MSNRIRVLCVDDHQIVREGISLLLSLQPDMYTKYPDKPLLFPSYKTK